MLQLFDMNKKRIALLSNFKDFSITKDLSNGDKQINLLYLKDDLIDFIKLEGYLRTKDDEFVIKELRENNEGIQIYAALNIEDLEGKPFERFESEEKTIEECLRLALAGTGWIIKSSDVKKRRTIKLTNKSAWEIIKEAKKVYRVDIVFNSLEKSIEIYEKLGQNKGTYFIENLNLKELETEAVTTEFYTRIIPIGKDGLKITEVNEGKDYLENYQYSTKIKTYLWIDERYTNVESLKQDAELKLEELSRPSVAYQAQIIDLASNNKIYKDILSYGLGDEIYLVSKSKGIKDTQRIVKTIEFPKEPWRNSCEMSNTFLTFEEMQEEVLETVETVDNITEDNGTISEGAIKDTVNKLTINKADIQDLQAVNAKIGNLEANKANIDELYATNAKVENLEVNKANVTELNATNGKIEVLESKVGNIDVIFSDVANIKDLINGNLSSENIQSGGITGDRLNMNTVFINDGNIINVNASKVNTGELNTNQVKIKSENGGIEIVGATQQFKDKNNKVRIQMGQDTQGNFNFILKGEDGTTTLIDHEGIKEKAIADNLIKENMITENAIGEKAIDYNSFATGFNKDTNTNTLKATKVRLDNENQTLEVAFNSLKNKTDGNTNTLQSHTTEINIQQGKINTLIQDTTIIKDGQTIKLKDEYNKTVQTVDSMKNTITSHETTINQNTGKITGVEIKTNELERNLNGFSSRLSSTENTVSSNTSQIDNNKNNIININTEISKTNNKVSGIEQNLNNINLKVSEVEKTTVTHTATLNNHTNSLNAVDGKINTSKNEAINSANNHTNNQISIVNEKVSTNTSAIDILKNQISLKVEQTDIDKTVANVNIGGTNLASGTSSNPVSIIGENRENQCVNVATIDQEDIVEKEVTISFEYSASEGARGSFVMQTAGSYWIQVSKRIDVSNSKIGKSIYTLRISRPSSGIMEFLQIRLDHFVGTLNINKVKLEEGNKNTAWSPSQKDLEKYTITKITEAKAEIKLTTDSINLEVSKKVNSNAIISSINQTAEAIKIKANKIELNGATTIGDSENRHIKIEKANYSIWQNSKKLGYLGFQDDEKGGHPKLVMGWNGIDVTRDDYLTIHAYPTNTNPEGVRHSYADLAYHCINRDDWSNIKMYGDGSIKISPLTSLEITTNSVNGSYVDQSERRLCLFDTSSSQYFNSNLQIPAIRNMTSNYGLILADDHIGGGETRVRVQFDGTDRFFRPLTNSANIQLGSGGYKWKKVYSADGVGYSASCEQPLARTINNDPDLDSVIDTLDFTIPIEVYNKSDIQNRQLGINIYSLQRHKLKNLFIHRDYDENERGEITATESLDLTSLLHLALYEIQSLKREIKILKGGDLNGHRKRY